MLIFWCAMFAVAIAMAFWHHEDSHNEYLDSNGDRRCRECGRRTTDG